MKIHAEEISSKFDASSELEDLLLLRSSIFEDLSVSSWNEAERPGLHSSILPFAIGLKSKEIH